MTSPDGLRADPAPPRAAFANTRRAVVYTPVEAGAESTQQVESDFERIAQMLDLWPQISTTHPSNDTDSTGP